MSNQRGRGGREGRRGLKGDPWCHICKVTNPDHQPEFFPVTECYWCGEVGHQKTVCEQYFCYKCKKQSHLARQCAESQESNAEQPSTSQAVQPATPSGSHAEIKERKESNQVESRKLPRAPVSVESNSKKMFVAVNNFADSLKTELLDERIKNLDEAEVNLRKDFKIRLAKIRSAKEKLIAQRSVAAELSAHYQRMTEGAQKIREVLGIVESNQVESH